MTPRENEQLEHLEHLYEELLRNYTTLSAQYTSLFNVISGNDPVVGKQLSFGERLAKVEKGYNFIRILLIGIGIGILVGGLIFGVLTLKQVTDAIKTVAK